MNAAVVGRVSRARKRRGEEGWRRGGIIIIIIIFSSSYSHCVVMINIVNVIIVIVSEYDDFARAQTAAIGHDASGAVEEERGRGKRKEEGRPRFTPYRVGIGRRRRNKGEHRWATKAKEREGGTRREEKKEKRKGKWLTLPHFPPLHPLPLNFTTCIAQCRSQR
jgi:hypothetical protein